MTRKQLYELALAAVGGNTGELAKRLGFTNVNTAATEFNRYKRNESMGFERTLAFLKIAGLLRDLPEGISDEAEEAAAPVYEPLEEVLQAMHIEFRDRLDTLDNTLKRGFANLVEEISQVRQAVVGQSAPPVTSSADRPQPPSSGGAADVPA